MHTRIVGASVSKVQIIKSHLLADQWQNADEECGVHYPTRVSDSTHVNLMGRFGCNGCITCKTGPLEGEAVLCYFLSVSEGCNNYCVSFWDFSPT